MSKAIVIGTNGSVVTQELNDLESIHKVVGGYIEHITFPFKKNCCLSGFINEEGKLDNLPVNRIATNLWQSSNKWDKLYDFLVGSVIITGEIDPEGNTKDISDEQIEYVLSRIAEITGENN